jgi:hypothetical protein
VLGKNAQTTEILMDKESTKNFFGERRTNPPNKAGTLFLLEPGGKALIRRSHFS